MNYLIALGLGIFFMWLLSPMVGPGIAFLFGVAISVGGMYEMDHRS